jgi:hypothetical protein
VRLCIEGTGTLVFARVREPVNDCSVKELHYHMKQFMEAMSKITADVIHVTIRSANQQDLVVVDPPGDDRPSHGRQHTHT